MTQRTLTDYLFTGTQLLLFVAYIFDFPLMVVDIPIGLSYLGLVLAMAGIIISLIALIQIRKSLSPFPTPLPNAQLITQGIFKHIRHPIYSGILLAGLGYALYKGSLYKAFITILLYFLFYFKSRYEEKLLRQKFPAYEEYQKSTGRFWP